MVDEAVAEVEGDQYTVSQAAGDAGAGAGLKGPLAGYSIGLGIKLPREDGARDYEQTYYIREYLDYLIRVLRTEESDLRSVFIYYRDCQRKSALELYSALK